MTDHELLELAARAVQATGDPDFANYTTVEHAICLDLGARRNAITIYWNPLNDDGDAFRLAVRLRIPITFPFGEETVRVWCGEESTEPIYLPLGRDPFVATRRAITHAAAEIGKCS
jgi:hypothetical protein